ncbi:MAG: DNA translocase FtsK, partial [Clostridia bacterium]|nr:DNA translocase FtsK [Clostridia bacterium]
DLSKMPHLLVAGTTGSGKSVCLNAMIMSLLYKATPEEIKMIMVDPKKVEFSVYQSIPHLLVPVVSDPRKAAGALSWAAAEMDKRYALFAEKGVRNIQGYNTIAAGEGLPKMPTIVIFIDELSDLMMVASKEVEDSICRLAQKARAAGMVLVIATQRPSVDVITGLIKANIPSRIALTVKSQIDSRTIIDQGGAEKLLGHGDMLFCPVNLSKPLRVQGCYVDDEEIERVVNFVSKQSGANYDDSVMEEIEKNAAREPGKKKNAVDTELVGDSDEDEMFPKAVEVVVEAGMASTTLLQRKLKLGYARAARIIDELSERGVIGPFEGSKPRKVLITKEQWMEMQANSPSAPRQLSVDDLDEPAEEHNYLGSAVSVGDYDVGDE